ncbi:Serine/threonine-protein kinase pkn3 [Minicystis rosea]|nr:Serine/threonine-protein kinase pkn3 [Minicystis rosea]
MTTSTPKPSDVPLTEGEILAGKYRVERVLGRGGMGVVVAAQHIHLRQKVAIKFLLPDATQEVVERFLREARAAVRLKSEHVTRVLDVGELEGGAPFMVMEYLEGSDLSQVLKKRGPLSVEDAVDYVLQACEAIGEAHQLGIVHRDLKPANLFLTKGADGSAVVKVLDFGISKDTSDTSAEEEMQLTRTRAVLGSPYYMAPEQMKSTRNVDARADIWSLGIILYQLLTKKVPYKAESFVALCIMVVNEDPPPPTTHRADLPPGLEAAILRALRKKPEERYASVSELAAAIAPFGNAGAALSAERIARVQGAPLPSIERPTSQSIVPPAAMTSGSVGSALSAGPSIPSVAAAMPASPTAAGSPSIPPPTSEQPGGAAAATASATGAAWSGAPTIQARRTGTKIVGVGAGVAALAIAGIVALRGRGDVPTSQPVNVVAVTTVVTAATVDVPAVATSTARPGATGSAPPTITAAETAAPLASGEAAPSARPSVKPAASSAAKTAAPAAPTAAPQPPPAAAPPPAAPPAKKKNPLDMDLQ